MGYSYYECVLCYSIDGCNTTASKIDYENNEDEDKYEYERFDSDIRVTNICFGCLEKIYELDTVNKEDIYFGRINSELRTFYDFQYFSNIICSICEKENKIGFEGIPCCIECENKYSKKILQSNIPN